MLHPESTAYDLFDGSKYTVTALPELISDAAKRTLGKVDARLKPMSTVLGWKSVQPEKRMVWVTLASEPALTILWQNSRLLCSGTSPQNRQPRSVDRWMVAR